MVIINYSVNDNTFSDDVIPPQSTLKFDVELLEIHDGPGDESDDAPSGGPGDSGDIFTEIDADKDHQLSQDEVGDCQFPVLLIRVADLNDVRLDLDSR